MDRKLKKGITMNRSEERDFIDAMTVRLRWYEEIIEGKECKLDTCPDIINRRLSLGNRLMLPMVKKHYKDIIKRLNKKGYEYT
jgi:hypothetical protein